MFENFHKTFEDTLSKDLAGKMHRNLFLKLVNTLLIFTTLVNADRRKAARTCERRFGHPLRHLTHPTIVTKLFGVLGMHGSFFEYTPNWAEQLFGHNIPRNNLTLNRIFATTYGNERVDAAEQGSPSNEILAQEGRSFCVSGEHFRNVPELNRHLNFIGMRGLSRNNFDVGTHSDHSDYSLMNVFPWRIYNLPINIPNFAILQQRADDGSLIFIWEPAEETFFHTRITKKNPQLHPTRIIHQGFRNRPSAIEFQPDPTCENPYFIDVTEIDADGVRLHNWLHITVYVKRESIIRKRNCATGRMRYIMLEVRDSLGLPIGDFNAEVSCGTSCKCKSANCKMVNGTVKNAMPCMTTPLRAITQPGIFMYSVAADDYFDEVHVSWHFAQHTSYFAYQLHFAALIVERSNRTRYYNSRQTSYTNPLFCSKHLFPCEVSWSVYGLRPPPGESLDWIYTEDQPQAGAAYNNQSCSTPGQARHDMTKYHLWASRNRSVSLRPNGYYAFTLQHMTNKTRPYGWTAQYTALLPTIQTLGAWDIFRSKYVQTSLMNCHKKLDSEFFGEGEFNKGKLPKRDQIYRYVRNYSVYLSNTDVSQTHTYGENNIYSKEIAISRAQSDDSDYVTHYSMRPLVDEFGDWKNSMDINATFKVPKFYFGTEFTRADYALYEAGMPVAIRDNLAGRASWDMVAELERCACPALPTTQHPDEITRPAHQLQGRSTHAAQMLLAWVVLVPIGVFCIRYYKETYSRVFLLQEFWWYSVHVLCMGTAWIFMMGGIYAIEIKKLADDNFNMSDEALVHVILGLAAIVMFTLQLFLAPFRLWPVKWRIVQIMFHFTFGAVEYAFVVAATLLAAVIPQGRMSCSAFYIYVSFLIVQIIIYVCMEFHMRYVDRLLDLFPERTYLPPPVVRLFHTSAPLSKLRIYILGFYAIFCWVYCLVLQGQVSVHIASCFKNLGNEYEEESY